MDPSVLARKQLTELKAIASQLEMRGYQRLKKAELVDAIVRAATEGQDAAPAAEQLDLDSAGNARAASADDSATATGGGDDDGDGEAASTGPARRRAAGGDDDSGRARVRTRTRERTQEGDDAEGDDRSRQRPERDGGGDQGGRGEQGGRAADQEQGGRGQRDGGQRGQSGQSDKSEKGGQGQAGGRRDQARQAGQGGQGNQNQGAQRGGEDDRDDRDDRDDDEDGSARSRRSRRERRRNKGGQGQEGQSETREELGEVRTGVLDILPEGYGFLRTTGYLPSERDVYVSQSLIRRQSLRRGDEVSGPIRQQKHSDKVPALHTVESVNGAELRNGAGVPVRPDFADLTPVFPADRLRLETKGGPISMRIVDLMAPIGKGQRALIVSPPKTGRTTILKELGQAIAANNPDVHLMVVLVDERPEEVTDLQRSVPGEVIASTFDRPAEDHTQIAELAIERAKRLVEAGRDVVVLLDSITRLSRAFNQVAPPSGRIMSGGVDAGALYPAKRFFGAARNIEDGGSLTIIATALIETGFKMDEVIFEEFKGTENMELRLDRRLERKRVFPAIDIEASGTRKEELLLDAPDLRIIDKLRLVLQAMEGSSAVELLIDRMEETETNDRFLLHIEKNNLQG